MAASFITGLDAAWCRATAEEATGLDWSGVSDQWLQCFGMALLIHPNTPLGQQRAVQRYGEGCEQIANLAKGMTTDTDMAQRLLPVLVSGIISTYCRFTDAEIERMDQAQPRAEEGQP